MRISKLDLILSKISDEDFRFFAKRFKKSLEEKFKILIIKKIGKLLGTPTYFLFKFFLSGLYYSYVLPKRLIAKNKLKSVEFNQNMKDNIDEFEKSDSIKDFIKVWKAKNGKVTKKTL